MFGNRASTGFGGLFAVLTILVTIRLGLGAGGLPL